MAKKEQLELKDYDGDSIVVGPRFVENHLWLDIHSSSRNVDLSRSQIIVLANHLLSMVEESKN